MHLHYHAESVIRKTESLKEKNCKYQIWYIRVSSCRSDSQIYNHLLHFIRHCDNYTQNGVEYVSLDIGSNRLRNWFLGFYFC